MKGKQKLISILTLIWMLFSIIPTYQLATAKTVPIENSFILKATGHCGYISLEWTPVEGATHYYIYRGINEGNQHSMPLTDFPIKETFYQDGSDIKEGVKYCYYVRAVGTDKKEFLQSLEACAIPTCSSSNPCKEPPIEEDCKLSLKYQTGNKFYWVNDVQKGPMEAAPENKWNRMFLVVRFVTQEVGAQIAWDGANRIVTIDTTGGNKLEFQIGNNKYKLNGIEDYVDPNNTEVAPYILAGRTMLPLRRTGEALDAEDILWDGATRTAELIFEEPGCNCEASCPYPVFSPAQASEYDLVSNCDMRYMGSKKGYDYYKSTPSSMSVVPHPNYLDLDSDGDGILDIEELARSGACMMYGTTSGRWRSPDQSEISVYRHKFCTDDAKEIQIKGHSFGAIKIVYGEQSKSSLAPLYEGEGKMSFSFTVPAGTHYLYFEHHIEEGKPAGLIYGGKFRPLPDQGKPPVNLRNEQHCNGTFLFCAKILEACSGNTVKVQTTSGTILTVNISTLTTPLNPCADLIPGSSWYIGGELLGTQLHATYLHQNEESCDKEELQRLRCICVEVLKIDRDTYTIYTKVNGIEMKFSYFAHQNQWLWSGLNIDQLKEGHCYNFWVVSKPAYLPPKVFYFKEVECPCSEAIECNWSPQGRIVSTRWDESDRLWIVNFLTCDNETVILYTPTDLLDISGTYPISQSSKLCVRFCLDREGKKILKWEVMPEPCCPEQDEKKICGCIVRMTLDPDGNGNYHVYIKQNCALTDPAYDLVLFVPATLLDTNMGFDILSYFHMFSDPDRYNKDTVCVEMKFNSSLIVTEWKAFPDRQPCCEEKPDCQWTQNGYLVNIDEKVNADGTMYWVVTTKDCDGNVKDYTLHTDPNVFFAQNNPNFPLSKVGDQCLKLCLRQVPALTHVAFELVAWELVDGECCPQTKKLCGCIIRMTLEPDANGNYKIYIKKNCKPAQAGEPAFDIALDIPSTLLDSNLGINALAYFNMMPGTAPKYNVCVDLIYNSSNQVTQWWANPDRQPCCEDKPDCQWTQNGYLVTIDEKINADGSKYWLVIFKDCDGNIKDYTLHTDPNVFFAQNNPNFPLSKVGDQCLKLCLRQVPTPTHVAFELVAWELVDGECCPQTKRGRIVVKMPKECLDGTIVSIYNQNGTEVWSGKANSDGVFDTDCKLPCPGTYKVVPKNEKCKFYPESREVIMTKDTCCDYTHVVDFKCECEASENKGRIQVKMPENCIKDTTVTIYDAQGNRVWRGTVNTQTGLFDTGCTLPCPGTYKVVPSNDKCKFSPESQEVKLTENMCCDRTNIVEFKCDCEKAKGRIQVKMSKECLEGTILTVYDASGREVWKGRPNPDLGYFDTGCTLPCPGTYRIVPKNEKCKFFPETATVTMSERMCCDYINVVEFKCECEQPQKYGRIQVKMSKECTEGTVVHILDANNREVWTGRVNPNTGMFDTDCKLPCPGTYKVVPKNEKCKFYPESATVNMSERMCCDYINVVEFKCECEEAKGRILISVSSRACLQGTSMQIYEGEVIRGKKPIMTLQANRAGQFDSGCVLKCNTNYTIVPINENCTFKPESKEVKVPCCPEYATAEFNCDCGAPGSLFIPSNSWYQKTLHFLKNLFNLFI